MISENMLIINKRIADYALTLCDKMGFSREYSGKEIYSFLLMYNVDFLNINLSDKNEITNVFKNLSFKRQRLFDVSKLQYEYLRKELTIIHLALLHFDINGNEIGIEEKRHEIEQLFGKDSFIYESINSIINYFYPKVDNLEKVILNFSGKFNNELKEYNIQFMANINDDIYNDLILYLIDNYVYIDVNEIIKNIKRYFELRHLRCDNFIVTHNDILSIQKIKSIIHNKSNDITFDSKYYFNFGMIDDRSGDYIWTAIFNSKNLNDEFLLAISYELNKEYSYYYIVDNNNEYYNAEKCPINGLYDYSFKMLLTYLVNKNLIKLKEKIK